MSVAARLAPLFILTQCVSVVQAQDPLPDRPVALQSRTDQKTKEDKVSAVDSERIPEMELMWDDWQKRVEAAIYQRFHSLSDLAFRRSGRMLLASADFNITKDGHITGVRLLQSSGSAAFNSLVVAVITSLDGDKSTLAFPPGSVRESISMKMGFPKPGNAASGLDVDFGKLLKSSWQSDGIAMSKIGQGHVAISFDICASGLESSYLLISSGSSEVDDAATKTVRSVVNDLALPVGRSRYRYNADFFKDRVEIQFVGKYVPDTPDAYEGSAVRRLRSQ